MEVVGVVVCTSRVVKMRENLRFCKEFSIFYMEDTVSVDRVESYTSKEKQFLKTQLLDG